MIEERQIWNLRDGAGHWVLELVWRGRALVDVTVGKYDYGGLFLRMPWRPGVRAAAVTSEGLKNQEAEGRRAPWVDVAMDVPGRDDSIHVALMDHPSNPGHPTPWRLDGQFGVGPCYARLGEWRLASGAEAAFRHRLVVYLGDFNSELVRNQWEDFARQADRR